MGSRKRGKGCAYLQKVGESTSVVFTSLSTCLHSANYDTSCCYYHKSFQIRATHGLIKCAGMVHYLSRSSFCQQKRPLFQQELCLPVSPLFTCKKLQYNDITIKKKYYVHYQSACHFQKVALSQVADLGSIAKRVSRCNLKLGKNVEKSCW